MPRLPNPWNLLTLLALFVALGGTTYAAAKIGSAEVRDGSLTGVDIRDGSLGEQELSAPAVDVPAEVVRRVDREPLELQVDPFVKHLELDAGEWAVTVTGQLDNEATVANASCSLSLADGESVAQDVRLAKDGAPGETAALALNGVVDGVASLTCASNGVRVLLEDVSMTAIRVRGAA
jgi:hypothetical protein